MRLADELGHKIARLVMGQPKQSLVPQSKDIILESRT